MRHINYMVQRVTLDSVLAKHNHDFPFHPEVLKLGLRYADGTIKGANARCIAMLDMLRQMVEDYTTPAGELLRLDRTTMKLMAVLVQVLMCSQSITKAAESSHLTQCDSFVLTWAACAHQWANREAPCS